MKTLKKYIFTLVLLFSSGASTTHAVPVDIISLYVDSATASISSPLLGSASVSETFAPIEITMGSYQDPIFSVGDMNFGLDIYSTGDFGAPAPSGYVDGTMISVDLSSLRAALTFEGTTYSDIELWPLTTTLDYGLYDPGNGDFLIGWSEVISIDVSSYLQTDADINVELGGYLTAVPVPAAIWLFGSGLLVIVGFMRRRKDDD